jgi:hypothetical protein
VPDGDAVTAQLGAHQGSTVVPGARWMMFWSIGQPSRRMACGDGAYLDLA